MGAMGSPWGDLGEPEPCVFLVVPEKVKLVILPKTNIVPENGCLEYEPGLFSGAMYVRF